MPTNGTESASPITQFRNCRILWKQQLMNEDLWIRDGKILNPEKLFFEEHGHADIVVDCNEAIIAPGYIDIQINGAFGIDFSFDTEDVEAGLQLVAKGILAHGVTSFCPTLVTSPPDFYKQAESYFVALQILPKIARADGSANGAGVLGVHIEGPYLSAEKKGAHPPEHIAEFTDGFQSVLDMYGSLDNVSILTLAPEKKGAMEVIQGLAKRGITVSLGHSVANLTQGEQAVQSGASLITHLFNAMLPFHHRDPHLVGLLASNRIPEGRTVFYGLIADGIHTHPAALRIAQRTHPDGLILVTDAMAAMGLGPGIHRIGQQKVEMTVEKPLAPVLAGTNTLAGSAAMMHSCVQHLIKSTGCSIVEGLEAATLHPAQALEITDRKGTLDYGTDADLVMLDDALNPIATYIAGERVWVKEDSDSDAGGSALKARTIHLYPNH